MISPSRQPTQAVGFIPSVKSTSHCNAARSFLHPPLCTHKDDFYLISSSISIIHAVCSSAHRAPPQDLGAQPPCPSARAAALYPAFRRHKCIPSRQHVPRTYPAESSHLPGIEIPCAMSLPPLVCAHADAPENLLQSVRRHSVFWLPRRISGELQALR